MSQFLSDTLIYTGALIAAALLLRRPVARAFGAQAAYALWALPLVRLLLPPIELPAWMAPKADVNPSVPADAIVVMAADPVSSAAAPSWTWSEAAMVVWLAGAVILLGWRVIAYRRMRAMLLADALAVGEVGKVRLVESPALQAPVAFGVTDKVIALPIGFMAWADKRARDLAIEHELAHHARHDLLANMAAQPLLALHWFNPLAWLGWRAMRRDQEAACDARVLAEKGRDTRLAYGQLIAGLAGGPRLALAAPMACPVLGEKSIIHRLRSLTMPEPTKTRRRIGLGLICGAALALPLTATIGYAAPDAPEAPPAPPVPDAPPAADGKHQQRIVIVERVKDGKHEGRSPKFSKTIAKDGKTIVIRSDKELSDADIDAKIAEIDKNEPGVVMIRREGDKDGKGERRVVIMTMDGSRMKGPMAPPMPPVPPMDGSRREMRIMKMGPGGDGAMMAVHCKQGEGSEINADGADKDGKKQVVRMRFCGVGADAPKQALLGLKRARGRIAENGEMSAEVKAKVLESLDLEIDRLSKKGG